MSFKRLSLSLFIGSLLALTACQKKASEEIDFGSYEGTTYSQPYFGFSIDFPEDWVIQSREVNEGMMDMGGDLIAGEDQNLKARLKASEMNIVNLFAVMQHELGAPVAFNPSILSVAERIKNFPGIHTGEDYLFHARKLLESGQVKSTFPKPVYPELVGGQEFYVMTMELPVMGTVVHQKYYATILRGYALGIILSYSTDEELEQLTEVLGTLRFE